ncbi:MAG: hypothetical protein MnENMB40S_04610 [Rhizobiaceae bacterium MnEN-MB40S]|nr:MAG: hypothetical protein MnENMB40S_04610 [Rhizobiaceae bacterium MnEN-MB40S]
MSILETVQRVLEGAADYHLHVGPDHNVERSADGFEAAENAVRLGMKALGIKCHSGPTGVMARMISSKVPGVAIIGTVALNREVGGINPLTVETDARLGTKKICMPSTWSTLARRKKGFDDGVEVLASNGEVIPEVKEVLQLAREKDLIIETGHLWQDEIAAVFKAAKDIGVQRFVVTHASKIEGQVLPLDFQLDLAEQGALIEHCFAHTFPFLGNVSVDTIAQCMRHVGVDRCILSTDLGQAFNPVPWEGMKMAVATMLKAGFSAEEIETMVKHNPCRMLDV